MATGYDPEHLDVRIDLPSFADGLRRHLARSSAPDPDYFSHHPNYSVAVNERGSIRAPVVAALNVDQGLIERRGVTAKLGKKSWQNDPGFFGSPAITNPYYTEEPKVFDRGHMAMRKNTAWAGGNGAQARAVEASKETYYWSNSALQHQHLNQDEWQDLELWAQKHARAKDGRLSTFTGPLFSGAGRARSADDKPDWQPVEVPAGFFKIIAFVGADTGELRVFAFVLYQDARGAELTAGYASGRIYDAQSRYNDMPYQSTVTEIEQATGIEFPAVLRDTNPLLMRGASGPRAGAPEAFEIFGADDLVPALDATRPLVRDHESAIYLAAAMVNPVGADRGAEWVSLLNLGAVPEFVDGWTLLDRAGGSVTIQRAEPLAAQEGMRVPVTGNLRLRNRGDFLRLMDADGARIDWVRYSARDVEEGEPLLFLAPRDSLG